MPLNWLITLHILLKMAASAYSLLPIMKKNACEELSDRSDDEVISEGEDLFEDQGERFYTTGTQMLKHRRKKVCGLQAHHLGSFHQCIIMKSQRKRGI